MTDISLKSNLNGSRFTFIMESIVCLPCPDTTEQFKTESNVNNTAIQSFKYMCPKGCGYGTNLKCNYNKHLNRKKDCTRLPDQNKAIFKYICPKCGYGTNLKKCYNRHLNRKKDCTTVPEGTKRCSKCSQVKIKMEFYKGQCHCKECEKNYTTTFTRKKCEHPGCRSLPSFGHDRKATHCGEHKKPDMESTHKKCEHPGCGTAPCYGYDRKATHCAKHKQPNMESTAKKCEHPGCGIAPCYGYDGKATHCAKHKQPDMESTAKTCQHGRARHMCPDCQGPVISKYICKICIKTTLSRNRIQLGICAKCDPNASEIMRTEEIMREMIINLVKFEPSSIDSSIIGVSCQELEKRRPDFIYVLPNVVIVIEIDEDSHVHYESSCEMAKISQQNAAIQLCDGLESVDVITIRLNPDAYHIGKVSRETRSKAVADRVNKLIDEYQDKFYDRTGYQRVEYYYYHKKAQHHIDAQGQISDVMVFPQT